MSKKQVRRPKLGQVRIIGGELRSRIIHFPIIPGLRPTPNRIRETLFNWLTPIIPGACCLDMFAGSGALSFEAKSRGAGYSLLFDASAEIIQALKKNIQKLNIKEIEVFHATFPYHLSSSTKQYDVIFIDPPFHQNYVQLALDWLDQQNILKDHALIYIESEADAEVFNLPSQWRLIKDKKAGLVRYSLVQT